MWRGSFVLLFYMRIMFFKDLTIAGIFLHCNNRKQ